MFSYFAFQQGGYTHDIHTTLHRSKVDCPQLEEMATVSFDGAVLGQIPASMSYLCVGSSGKADKKKKKGKDAKVVAYLSDKEIFYVEDKVGGVQLWDSFSHPSNTILLEQMLGFDSKSGTKNVMTSWKSENDPSTGRYLVGLTPEAPTKVFFWINGSIPHWRSGHWDKSKFIGKAEMDDQYGSGFSLKEDKTQRFKVFL